MSDIPIKPPSPNLSFSQYLAVFENGDPSKLSPESRRYSQELAGKVSDEQTGKTFLRFVAENPSVQLVLPNDTWFKFLRKWMELPFTWQGDISRTQLRLEIRKEFPLLAKHYMQWLSEAESGIRAIENVGTMLDESRLTFVVQNAYLALRWLDDLDAPDMPTAARLSRADGISAMMKLRSWFQKKAKELEPHPESSSPQTVPPIAEFIDNSLVANAPGSKDEKGSISNPSDPTAYREASKIIGDFSNIARDIKAMNKILDQHPEIRRWKPRINRLSVHLGDWQRFVDGRSSGEWDDAPEEVEKRKREIRERKDRK